MLSVKTVANAGMVFKVRQCPIGILFSTRSKYNYFEVLLHVFEELVSCWPNRKLAFVFIYLFPKMSKNANLPLQNVGVSRQDPTQVCTPSLFLAASKAPVLV